MLARLYRQAPLNSIWEGSGNIQCLDVLRALAREPAAGAAVASELRSASGLHPALDAEARALSSMLEGGAIEETRARHVVERTALALQAALLLRAHSPVAGTFCRTRLQGEHGLAMGTLPADAPFDALIARALPD